MTTEREGIVGSVVNLNRARKARKRADDERQAAQNRLIFGRSKAERERQEADRKRAARELDSKRID